MAKVSIIIPVYNVEKYLRQCVESALNQTLKDIEIICVNDGSTDSSGDILAEMSVKDSRIKILSKPNAGYGHTMNVGIDNACGKYIVFLESDDYILPEMCETMYRLCEEHDLDIVKADFYEFKSRGNETCARYFHTSDYGNYHCVLEPVQHWEVFFASMYTWTCMYRKGFIEENHIYHNETPGASYQDNGFWFQSLMHCKRLYLLEQAFYMYRQDNPDSSLHSTGMVNAFSNEYQFIRSKILEQEKNVEKLMSICAFFNIYHNINRLQRVDACYVEELLRAIVKDFYIYAQNSQWDVGKLDNLYKEKLLYCLGAPKDVMRKADMYRVSAEKRKSVLAGYEKYVLYGAGKYADRVLAVIEHDKMWDKDIYCGVTDTGRSGEYFHEIKIESIESLFRYGQQALFIVCAKRDSDFWRQMYCVLETGNISHVISADELNLDILDMWDIH